MNQKLSNRNFKECRNWEINNEEFPTTTSNEQSEVEKLVSKRYWNFYSSHDATSVPDLLRHKHIAYLTDSLYRVPRSYQTLDASRTWICYWILHSLSLLEVKLSDKLKSSIAKFIAKCQNPSGGFGGGPNQISHLAPTYAAINALIIIGTEEAYSVINREKMLDFLWSLKLPNGSFTMHVGGEIDIRGVYCALAVASLTNILSDKLCENTAEWIISCQSYEGGFSGAPGMEAHGGYAFCGLAGLIILGKHHLCDLQALLRWLVNRQMKLEGGFQGRTNKLVDGCYSFWQGGAFALIHSLLDTSPSTYLFDNRALQEYILTCCQHPSGGLIDKPGKNRDEYHTCYVLSGLSIAQHFNSELYVLGNDRNEVACTHPVYNIRVDLLRKGILHFRDYQQE